MTDRERRDRRAGLWAVPVSGNWRVTFRFDGPDAVNVDYVDDHEEVLPVARERKPSHPGEVLYDDVMKPLGLTVTEAARKLGVSRKTLSVLINRRASMSAEMALRVARATKTSAESWLNMQLTLDLREARRREPKIAGEIVRA